MELIFYDETARLLGVSVDTVKHAVSRGELTTAGTLGNRQRLIKEQVMLFAGVNPRTGHKKRISYNALSADEQRQWHHYANELDRVGSALATPDIEQIISEKVREELARQEYARLAEQEKKLAEQKERFHKEHPFLIMRQAIPA